MTALLIGNNVVSPKRILSQNGLLLPMKSKGYLLVSRFLQAVTNW